MTADHDYNKYDLTRLRTELEQEREMKEMLEESVSDLRSTMCELQERLRSVDGEGSEWKTRYETQKELKGQLERQMSLIHERLDDLRGNPMDRLASIRSYDDMPVETLRQRLKLLTEERSGLHTQLMDCHLRIEQEGKAFLKTNDERRAYISEIAKCSFCYMIGVLNPRRPKKTVLQPATESTREQREAVQRRGTSRGRKASRKAEADPQKSEKEREDDGGGAHVKGGGGGIGAVERRQEKRSERGGRLPTLKH